MKVLPQKPPRAFRVGKNLDIEIKDCGRIHLEPDQQVTFMTEDGKEYDLARKSWGYYATPSLNARLKNNRLRASFVRNSQGKYFIFLVELEKEADFFDYLKADEIKFVCWLDDDQNLKKLEAAFS